MVAALGSAGPDARVQVRLVEMLSDQEAQVRAAVVTALKTLGTEAECRDRLPALTKESDPNVRAQAAGALLRVAADPDIRKRLLDLIDDPESDVRSAALQSLRGWSGPAPRSLAWRLAWRLRKLRLGCEFEDALMRISPGLWLELDTPFYSPSEAGEAWLTLDLLLQAREQQS